MLESLIREGISPISVDDGIEMLRQAARRPGDPAQRGGHGPGRRPADDHAGAARAAAGAGSSTGRGSTTRASSWSPTPSCPPTATRTSPITCSTATCCSPRCSAWRRWRRRRGALTGRDGAPVARERRVPAADRGAGRRHDDDPDRGAQPTATGRRCAPSAAARPASRPTTSAPRSRHRRPPAGRRRPVDRSTRPPVPLDPAADLYGGVLFQGERFQRAARLPAARPPRPASRRSRPRPATTWFGSLPARATCPRRPGRPGRVHARASSAACRTRRCCRPASSGSTRPTRPRRPSRSILHAAERRRGRRHLHLRPGRLRDDGRHPGRALGRAAAAGRAQDTTAAGRGFRRCSAPTWSGRPRSSLGTGLRCVVEPDPASGAEAVTPRRRQTERGGEPDARAAGDRRAPRRRQARDRRRRHRRLGLARRGRDPGRGRHRAVGCDVEAVATGRRRTGGRCSAHEQLALARADPARARRGACRSRRPGSGAPWSACARPAAPWPEPTSTPAKARPAGCLLAVRAGEDRHVRHRLAGRSRTRWSSRS